MREEPFVDSIAENWTRGLEADPAVREVMRQCIRGAVADVLDEAIKELHEERDAYTAGSDVWIVLGEMTDRLEAFKARETNNG